MKQIPTIIDQNTAYAGPRKLGKKEWPLSAMRNKRAADLRRARRARLDKIRSFNPEFFKLPLSKQYSLSMEARRQATIRRKWEKRKKNRQDRMNRIEDEKKARRKWRLLQDRLESVGIRIEVDDGDCCGNFVDIYMDGELYYSSFSEGDIK